MWDLHKSKISITQFKQELLEALMDIKNKNKEGNIENMENHENHVLQEVESRRRCVECYKQISQ